MITKIFLATGFSGERAVVLLQLKVYTEMHLFCKKLNRTSILGMSRYFYLKQEMKKELC